MEASSPRLRKAKAPLAPWQTLSFVSVEQLGHRPTATGERKEITEPVQDVGTVGKSERRAIGSADFPNVRDCVPANQPQIRRKFGRRLVRIQCQLPRPLLE